MSHRERTWVMVLAGGGASPYESRKGEVTGPDRRELRAVPGRRSLLKSTLSRARSIVPRERICVVIDRAQQHYWSGPLEMLPGKNIIVQPSHRGSAAEMLLAAIAIIERDPWARIIAMPSHHYVDNESALASSLLDAANPTAQTRNNLTLVGIKPEEADPDVDYIVPGRWFEDGPRSVQRIVNPSGRAAARELVARGALWDSSIVAARAVVLLGLLRARMPDLIDQVETALAQAENADMRTRALTQLYARLPYVDFTRVIAGGAESQCRVITSRSCGWSQVILPPKVPTLMEVES